MSRSLAKVALVSREELPWIKGLVADSATLGEVALPQTIFLKAIKMTETRLERLRRVELEGVRSFFQPGMRVLEIGGGNGYQANLISSWGCVVTSIDVVDRPIWPMIYFDVQNYDGVNLPFPDESFDVVFSSNVLEHIPVSNLQTLLNASRRVLCKPQGVSIHILPTAAWRFWNNLAHYVYLCKYALGYGKTAMMPTVPSREDALKQYGVVNLLQRAIIPAPHGEYPNALSELYYFAKRRWVREFQRSGLSVQKVLNLDIFYTGYGLVQNISLENRFQLAKYLGTATCAYIVKAA